MYPFLDDVARDPRRVMDRCAALDALPTEVGERLVQHLAVTTQPSRGGTLLRCPLLHVIRPVNVGARAALDHELDEIPRVQQHRLKARARHVMLTVALCLIVQVRQCGELPELVADVPRGFPPVVGHGCL